MTRARRIADARMRAEVDRARGAPVTVGRTASSRWLEVLAPDLGALPCKAGLPAIQDPATGAFYFLVGYSAVGGGDVLA